ncbi:ornithine carbamoyltransferase [Xylanimonas allomyrinae]|uniref:Ornithine carbamoyltransferase n=1 Tax=Xylanimonas allomyrinae TaxID=2509459 RepID=A0A4V0YDY9_9MICO|nr:ornithine carbamoyltransferase [Xylanimonas allomyrinae]QAY62371.1 ornithine carbamoyltransferase [Xylanimonas allomyrinae]
MTVRHFLRDDDLTPSEQKQVLELGLAFREDRHVRQPLSGPRAVAFITDKPTLRTQVSFATGIAELGGFPLMVDGNLAQIGVRESIADTTHVLDRMVSAIVWRTFGDDRIQEMAAASRVPVVNALTDGFHPCQILADLLTVAQHRGGVTALPGQAFAYVGDCANNMAHSYLLGGATAGLHVRVAGPQGYLPDAAIVARARAIAEETGGSVTVTDDPVEAVTGADAVATDTWVSMGAEAQAAERSRPFVPFQLDAGLLAHARADAIVLHCLPAYRGKEITADVIDGPQSVVFDEAENRLHAQKALLTWLLEQR